MHKTYASTDGTAALSDPAPATVQTISLMKYRKTYKLGETPTNSAKEDLIPAIQRHFASTVSLAAIANHADIQACDTTITCIPVHKVCDLQRSHIILIFGSGGG